MTFGNLIVEGFGSLQGPFTFNLDTKQITIIKASNGVGKTTIFSALTWLLYGTPLKPIIAEKIPTWKHIRKPSFRGTRVMLTFKADNGIEYTIARHINFKGKTLDREYLQPTNDLIIFKDLIETQEKGKEDNQASIDKLIGMDYSIFTKTVIFGQKMKRFIEEADKDKRDFFDTIFSLDFVDIVKAKSEVLLSNEGQKALELSVKIQTLSNSIESNKAQLENIERFKLREKEEKEQTLFELETKRQEAIKLRDTLEDNIRRLKVELERLGLAKIAEEQRLKSLNDPTKKQALEVSKTQLSTTIRTLQEELIPDQQYLVAEYTILTELGNKSTADLAEAIKALDLSYQGELINWQEEYDGLVNSLKFAQSGLVDLGNKLGTHIGELVATEKSIANLNKAIAEATDVCPACNQKIVGKNLAQIKADLEAHIATETAKLADLTAKGQELEDEINAKKELITTLKDRLQAKPEEKRPLNEALQAKVLAEKADPKYVVDWTLYNGAYQAFKTKETAIQSNVSLKLAEVATIDKAIADLDIVDSPLLKEHEEAITKWTARLKSEEHGVTACSSDVGNIEARIEELENTKPKDWGEADISEAIASYERSLAKEALTVDLCNDRINKLTYLISKVFVPTGIKSKIFAAMLYQLNEAVEKWARKLGCRIVLSVDLAKKSAPIITEVYKGDNIIDYQSLSGGQQQRVNICLAFGLYDLIASKTMPILVLDEVFEGLDVGSVDLVSDIVKDYSNTGMSVFIITHHAFIDIPKSKTYTLEAEDARVLWD